MSITDTSGGCAPNSGPISAAISGESAAVVVMRAWRRPPRIGPCSMWW